MSVNVFVHEPEYGAELNVNVNFAGWSVRARYTLVPKPVTLYGVEPRSDTIVAMLVGAALALTVSVCAAYVFDAVFCAAVSTTLLLPAIISVKPVNEITPDVASMPVDVIGTPPSSVIDAEVAIKPYVDGANRIAVAPEPTVDGASE
jgi:hypothetical protein